MRNLKKILALVLALVMSLSLMATAGAGSFQDVTDDNPYKTAIDVLDELKVFQGFEDGTFKPDSKLNRAQAAVLVYRIATGDVEGKFVANYTDMAQSKFDDLTGYEWARGYINYCQNAKIVVGTSATKFSPEKDVTGYQLMVMLLRTLGYGAAGEFSNPTSWELETAKIAEREGILKNVTGGDFGAAAPRQMVAEILFQGLLQNTVQYSTLTPGGYTKSGVILGKNVGLEEITGVVTANEIADLDDTTPLEAGKTRLETEEGRIYTLDVPSAATDIGETRHAYIQNGTKVLGVLADTGDNKINENPGVGTTLSKVIKDMNVRLTDDTQYYINFGDSEQYTCERRLEYSVTFDNTVSVDGKNAQKWFEDEYGVKVADIIDNKNALDEVEDTSYTRVIPAEKNITEDDLAIMRGIFSVADNEESKSLGITGYVFAGTNSTSAEERNKDLSEDISWRQFYRDYINPAAYNISGSDNGEWFKVIDNDNDGNVDFVLLTRFVMTTITDYNSRTGYYTTEWTAENEEDDHTKFLDIHKDDIVSVDGEDLAIDDVILYAKIDGKYYVDHPDTVDTSITKFTYKTDTITCADEQDRVWSGIDKEAAAFFEDITDPEMETKRPYTLYLDHFGYVRLVTDTSKGFVLLTDGYYETNRRDEIMKATVYDLAAEKLEDVTVVKDAGESAYYYQNETPANDDQFGYIDTWEDDHNGNRGTWERLSTFGMYRYGSYQNIAPYYGHYDDSDEFQTNVALATIDGDEYSLSDIGAKNSRSNEYRSYELTADFTDFNVKARNLDGIVNWSSATAIGDTIRINTTGNTRYYWVSWDDDDNTVVQTWLGYSNAPDGFSAERGYAITSTVTSVDEADANYETAQIVVFEGKQTTTVDHAMIAYACAEGKRYQGLGWDGEGYSDESKIDHNDAKEADLLNAFVYAKNGDKITSSFGKYGLWAGFVVTSRDTSHDYYQFSRPSDYALTYSGTVVADPDGKPVADYDPETNNEAYSVIDKRTGSLKGYATETADLKLGEKVIYFVDGKANVQLAINVDRSDADDIYNGLEQLWKDIVDDYANYQGVTVERQFNGIVFDNTLAYDISKGAVEIDLDDLLADTLDFALKDVSVLLPDGKASTDAKVTFTVKSDGTYLSITGLKGNETIQIDYTAKGGKIVPGEVGPVVIALMGANAGDLYQNFEIQPKGADPALKSASAGDTLNPGDDATLFFDVKTGNVPGAMTIYGKPAAATVVAEQPEGMGAGKTWTKWSVDFTMPEKTDDSAAICVITLEAADKQKETPVEPEVKVEGDTATAAPSVGEIQNSINNATEENPTVTITVPEDKIEDAKTVAVELNKDVLTALTDETNAASEVSIETPKGSAALSTNAIGAILEANKDETTEEAPDGIVVVIAEADASELANDNTLTEEQKAAAVVVDVTIKDTEGKKLTVNLEGEEETITLTVPATGKADGEKVNVYFVNGAGNLENIAEDVVVKNGNVTFETSHLTVFAVVSAPAKPTAVVTVGKANVGGNMGATHVTEYNVMVNGNKVQVLGSEIKSHKNGNNEDGYWIGFQVALGTQPEGSPNWTKVTYSFKGNPSKTIDVEQLPEEKTGIAFYYDAADWIGKTDTATVSFEDSFGNKSEPVTYQVSFNVSLYDPWEDVEVDVDALLAEDSVFDKDLIPILSNDAITVQADKEDSKKLKLAVSGDAKVYGLWDIGEGNTYDTGAAEKVTEPTDDAIRLALATYWGGKNDNAESVDGGGGANGFYKDLLCWKATLSNGDKNGKNTGATKCVFVVVPMTINETPDFLVWKIMNGTVNTDTVEKYGYTIDISEVLALLK